ncbi:MAG: hypothetical protein HAW59_00545 [Betaproteobacteria bacterium]|nr:hypothetical protein [Betaproteobacteria bacterium]
MSGNAAAVMSLYPDAAKNAPVFTALENKRADGRFYTQKNPFEHPLFRRWAARAGLPEETILEPFAGANHLIKMLRAVNLCRAFVSFDIVPGGAEVKKRDTLKNFPEGFNVCVTNPPWLARNSATRRGLPFPQTPHDDLYKHCLAECLRRCGYVAALAPESFIRSGLFLGRLGGFISLNNEMFSDTEHPAGLALFAPRVKSSALIFSGAQKLGTLDELGKHRPPKYSDGKIIFNAPDGNAGLIALDNNYAASIRFCEPAELKNYEIKQSSRAITKIKIPGRPKIGRYNEFLGEFRNATKDVFLTAYRGLRKDGFYRRRLDYALARDIIGYVGY